MTSIRRAAAIDLSAATAWFLASTLVEPVLDPILRRGNGLGGVITLAAYQFSCEGFAVCIVLLARREKLSSYGFTRNNLGKSVGMGLILAVLSDLLMSWNASAFMFIPFRRHSALRMSLSAGYPSNIIGIAIMIAVWGIVESFFGVFFSRKLNVSFGLSRNGWFSPGVLGFAMFNGLIHFAIGQGLAGFAMSFVSGYSIAVIPAVTENAWGSIVVQSLTNAAGTL